MSRIVTVAVREFVETVKTRAFLISVVFMPMLLLTIVLGSQRLSSVFEDSRQPPRRIAVVDDHGAVYAELDALVQEYNRANSQRLILLSRATFSFPSAAAVEAVRRQELYAVLHVPEGAVSGDAECTLARRDTQMQSAEEMSALLQRAIVSVRFRAMHLDADQVAHMQRAVRLADQNVATDRTTRESDMTRMLTPMVFMFALYFGTFGISWGLLTSVLEEKSSRVVEVLLSAVSPFQLMTGKILGMVLVGAVVLGVWGVAGAISAQARGIPSAISPERLLIVVLYFVPGFLLLASFMAMIGAACNTLKEAQSMASPLSMLNIIPVIFWLPISQYPQSLPSILVSYIPPITPFVMVLRVCADPDTPLTQIITTLALLWASVLAGVWAAARIFRIGVLMYGKPPTLGEMARWLRYS